MFFRKAFFSIKAEIPVNFWQLLNVTTGHLTRQIANGYFLTFDFCSIQYWLTLLNYFWKGNKKRNDFDAFFGGKCKKAIKKTLLNGKIYLIKAILPHALHVRLSRIQNYRSYALLLCFQHFDKSRSLQKATWISLGISFHRVYHEKKKIRRTLNKYYLLY